MASKVILIKQYRCKIIVLLELKRRGRDFVGLEQTNILIIFCFRDKTELNIKKSVTLILILRDFQTMDTTRGLFW